MRLYSEMVEAIRRLPAQDTRNNPTTNYDWQAQGTPVDNSYGDEYAPWLVEFNLEFKPFIGDATVQFTMPVEGAHDAEYCECYAFRGD